MPPPAYDLDPDEAELAASLGCDPETGSVTQLRKGFRELLRLHAQQQKAIRTYLQIGYKRLLGSEDVPEPPNKRIKREPGSTHSKMAGQAALPRKQLQEGGLVVQRVRGPCPSDPATQVEIYRLKLGSQLLFIAEDVIILQRAPMDATTTNYVSAPRLRPPPCMLCCMFDTGYQQAVLGKCS